MATQITISHLLDPYLEFGGAGEFKDPKEGLKHGGPFDLRFGSARREIIRIGFIGDESMITKAINWLNRIQKEIPSTMKNLVHYPAFPGFKKVFHTNLEFNDKWNYIIDQITLSDALKNKQSDAFKIVLDLYTSGFNYITKYNDLLPDILFCCLSQDIVDTCWSIENETLSRSMVNKIHKFQQQMSLFDTEYNQRIDEQTEDIVNRDFRRALKARAMKFGIPIQIGTDRLFVNSEKNQDDAIRAWNSSIAIYYKAGGIPWRLRQEGIDTCYVGISFHHLYTTFQKHIVRSCIAQAFSSDGEGFAIRGGNIPWDDEKNKAIHLTEEQAYNLGISILNEYKFRTGTTPLRIVLHKSTEFNEAESKGLRKALHNIPIIQLVNISPTDFRLIRFGVYPPKRGTLCTVNDDAFYLFTTGYMEDLKTYPGPHIPVPFRIKTDAKSDISLICSEILALTRMNWNTASITSGIPVTLMFARKVGGIISEFVTTYGENESIPTSFRYYL